MGKVADPPCPCGHNSEDGHHITFACPRFGKARKELIGISSNWEDLDAPRWDKEADDGPYGKVEACFGYQFRQLA